MNDHTDAFHTDAPETRIATERPPATEGASRATTGSDHRDIPTSPMSNVLPRKRNRVSRRAQQVAKASPTGRHYKRLSHLLKGLSPEELTGVLRAYPAAIVRGTVKAVEVVGRSAFDVSVLDHDGEPITMSVPEELVLVTTAWTAWLAQTRRTARYEWRARRGDSRATETALRRDEEDFERLCEIRRATLQASEGTL